MKFQAFISVIIPIYNVEKYLKQCVDSVLNQTFRDIEVILVDDGSLDSCPQICDEYARQDARIKVIHQKNGGQSSARNSGIVASSGKYLSFVDPDDWLDLDAYEKCYKVIIENNVDVLRFNYVREFQQSSIAKENKILEEKIILGEECQQIAKDCLGLTDKKLKYPENLNILASVCFNIFSAEIIKTYNLSFYDLKNIGTFEDGLFNLEVYMNMRSFIYINKPFYHYRKYNDKSLTSNYKPQYDAKQRFMYDLIYEKIKPCREQFIDSYYNRIVLSTMEVCLNALTQKGSVEIIYHEVKNIINEPLRRKAYKNFKISALPFKYKIYHLFVKLRLTPLVYLMTKYIHNYQVSR